MTTKPMNTQIFEIMQDRKNSSYIIPVISKEGDKDFYYVNKLFVESSVLDENELAIKFAERNLNSEWSIDTKNFNKRLNEWENDFLFFKEQAA